MKLPWDKNYLKISLHVIFTLLVTYILIVTTNGLSFVVANLSDINSALKNGVGRFFSVFSVLLVAFIIAYLFDPLAELWQREFNELYDKRIREFLESRSFFIKRKARQAIKEETNKAPRILYKKRTAGTLLTYLTIITFLSLGIFLIVRSIGGKTSGLSGIVDSFAGSISETGKQVTDFIGSVQTSLDNWGFTGFADDTIANAMGTVASFLEGISRNIVTIVTKTGSFIADLAIALVVAFYFLRDKEQILALTKSGSELFLPRRLHSFLYFVLHEINAVFSGYIRGQLLDGMIMAVLISVTLSLIGIDFAILIGIVSGFSNLVPYFGALVGFVLSILVALISGEPSKALYAGIAILALQQIDGMFIVPKVVGEKVELSPALVLLSLGIFGSLFGFVGLLFAVPLTSIIRLFIVREYHRRKAERQKDMNEVS